MTVLVSEIMAPTPVTARPETSVVDVARIMSSEDIGAVLITDDEKLVGLITDRDLVVRALAGNVNPETPVGELCSEQVQSVSPRLDVVQAAELMRNAAVRRLPVVEDGKPVGMVSLGDIAVESAPESVLGGISSKMPNT
jgi:CBS domain-containing protein